MPGNFPLVELRNFDSWIPTTDIDGIDAQPNVLADVSSMDFENGYIQNTFGVSTVDIPSNITTDISNGYNILSARKFDVAHGNIDEVWTHTFYVVYKGGASRFLKCYVDNESITIDGTNPYIVVDGIPNHINYNFCNNSLKINLNCNGTFASMYGAPVVVLNLSLNYIEDLIEYGGSVNLVTDGNFPTGSFAWTLGTGITITSGVARFTGVAQNQTLVTVDSIMTVGSKYRLLVKMSNRFAGGFYMYLNSPENYNGNIATSTMNWIADGLCYVDFTCATGEEKLTLRAFGSGTSNTFDLDDVVIYELPLIFQKSGWNIYPRWIGWQHTDVLSGSVTGSVKDNGFAGATESTYSYRIITKSALTYNSQNHLTGTINYGLSFRKRTGEFFQTTGEYDLVAYNPSPTYGMSALMYIDKPTSYDAYEQSVGSTIRDIDKIKLTIGCARDSWDGINNASMPFTVKIYDSLNPTDSYGNMVYLFTFSSETSSRTGDEVEIDVNLLSGSAYYVIEIACNVPPALSTTTALFNTYAFIKSFEIVPHNLALIVKTFDSQRGLIQYSPNSINNDLSIFFLEEFIDWRIAAYEIYAELNSIYYLSKSYTTSEMSINIVGVSKPLSLTELTSTTLNYNYNLPFDKRVDNQRNIYSEVTHKGRVYFVNEDEKVYQSHISANGVTQPDAFPYDEDTGFGYFIVNRDKQNKALAVTPDNNLGIFTNSSFYVYFIQASNGGAYKQLKLISGSVGISSINSIIRTLNGEPSTDGLFWCDRNGVYVYFGGVDPPINLIVPTHENYWAAISDADKDAVVMFYNIKDREIWVCFNNIVGYYQVMIYEIPYKKWKKRLAGSALVQEYCGVDENIFYFRYGNALFKYDYLTRAEGDFSTHKSTPNSENYWNILQEVCLVFDDSNDIDGEVRLQINAFCEEATIPVAHTLSTATKFHKLLMPLGFRFKCVSFDFTLTTVKLVRIKSLSYTYSEDNNEMLGQNVVHTYEHGFGVEPFGDEFGS